MPFLDLEGLQILWSNILSKLSNKVDHVEGKQLSTNDYTTTEKNKLASLENAEAITSERITEIIGIDPVMTLVVNENGDALINASFPDDEGNLTI